jgi:uncharacterized protein (TIGR02145 family)
MKIKIRLSQEKVSRLICIWTLSLMTVNSYSQTWINGNGLVDIEGNSYSTVIVNGREWMKENLKTSKFSNGDPIPNVTDNDTWFGLTTPAYSVYNNDNIYNQYYGKLYNWYVVNDNRKVCPAGWHVATDNEWKLLEMYLGMTQSQADNTSWRGTNEGKKLKSDYGWNSNGNGTNESGFEGLPGGLRHPGGNFSDLGNIAFWWTATGSGSLPYQNAFERRLKSIYDKVYRIGSTVKTGGYIRCVNDNPVSVEEIKINNQFIAYPNPVKNILSVEVSPTLVNTYISVITVDGVQLKKNYIISTQNFIDLTDLSSGIYFLIIGGESLKIIKD